MTWVRWQESPWGQRVLLGLSWDWLWVAAGAGALAIVVHALLRLRQRGTTAAATPLPAGAALPVALPARILRHTPASRLLHWLMAVSMLALLGTAFLPILGLKFAWVDAHWIAGLVLTAALAFHILHGSFWKGLRLMWIGAEDVRIGAETLRDLLHPAAPPPRRTGKNPLENKLFHHAVALATLAATVTGLVMLAKVSTPWWSRNPYLLSESAWGLVYLVHGAGSVALVALVLVHLYMALRPDKGWITLSMLRGWIPRERYLERYDSERWPPVALAAPSARLARGGADAVPAPSAGEARAELGRRIDAVEEAYEFMLAYAAQGLSGGEEDGSASQIRTQLATAEQALGVIPALLRQVLAETGAPRPAGDRGAQGQAFVGVLEQDAAKALAALRLVLAQPAISSQLVDNLNAMIHLRALLTDLFLIDETLRPHHGRDEG
ncbi:MAG: cytochrome b/b6 domain-containing protein [Candidatus Lambdaproteobacteria bacterium]|nr:cytochrome b/b6 domain-containing protein [Candidatus Lambdaproteobacteria bacterium]